MSNVELHEQAHKVMTDEGAEAVSAFMAPDIVFTDHAQGATMKGRDEATGWLSAWKTAFSDAAVTEGTYLEAGDWTISRFRARGTNDGEFAGLPPTGRAVDLDCCELIRWQDGKSVEGDFYYDAMTVMVQLGHIPPPGA